MMAKMFSGGPGGGASIDGADPVPCDLKVEQEWIDVSSGLPTRKIHDWMVNAARLGLDPRSPDVIRRCVEAGIADFERLESAGGRVVSYRALRAARRSGPGHPPVVYYMRQGDLVKIGTTTDIGSRAASIGAQGVMAIEPGDAAVEHRRHDEFAADRSHLEYFRLSAPLAVHVVEVRSRFEAEAGLTTEAWLAPRLPSRVRARRSTNAA